MDRARHDDRHDDDRVHDDRLDGSALAGMLSEVYAFDATLAVVRCATCGRTDVVARTRVHLSAMGAVVRCPSCDEVLLVVVERPDGTLVSAHGVAWVRAPHDDHDHA